MFLISTFEKIYVSSANILHTDVIPSGKSFIYILETVRDLEQSLVEHQLPCFPTNTIRHSKPPFAYDPLNSFLIIVINYLLYHKIVI